MVMVMVSNLMFEFKILRVTRSALVCRVLGQGRHVPSGSVKCMDHSIA
jgi:hypothetical protein